MRCDGCGLDVMTSIKEKLTLCVGLELDGWVGDWAQRKEKVKL